MLQNRFCLIIGLMLMLCQTNSAGLSRRKLNAPMNEIFRSNLQLNQQSQAGGFPLVVNDVNYNDASPLQGADRLSENTVSCTDKKVSAQIDQKSCPGGSTEEMAPKQKAPISSQGDLPSEGAMASPTITASSAMMSTNQNSPKLLELQKLVQQLYVAQAQVQLEATEIQRAQSIAGAAQQALEEAGNNVRVIQAALHAAQETVAGCALRAQTAQLQLAAHDQLLFTARQRVDALSAQMVGLQAEEGIGENKVVVDLPTLLAKLKEPLTDNLKPTPVPSILGKNPGSQLSQVQSTDPKKLLDQLKAWNDQHNAPKPEALVEKKQSLYDSLLLEGYGDDSLDNSPASVLSKKVQQTEKNSPGDAAQSQISELSKDEVRTLVDFIISTGRNQNGDNNMDKIYPEDLAKKTENEKYTDGFLNRIRNSEIRSIHRDDAKTNSVSSSYLGPKLTDQLLNLHENVFHPAIINQDMRTNELQDNPELEYDDRNGLENDNVFQ